MMRARGGLGCAGGAGRHWRVLNWGVLATLALAFAASAQETPQSESQPSDQGQPATLPAEIPELATAGLAREQLQQRVAQVEAATDLTEAAKAELVTLYKAALEQINLAEGWAAKTAEYRRGREEAPQLLEALRQSVAQAASRPTTAPVPQLAPDATLEQLNQRLAEAEADLKAKQEVAARLELEAKNRADRLVAIPDLLAEANTRLQKIVVDAGRAPPTGAGPQVAEARRILLAAQKRAVEEEITAYEEELRFYNARSDLLAARRDKARLDVSEAQAWVAAWQAVVSERRQAEVERQQRQAEEGLAAAPPAVQELAEENKRLAEERARLARDIDAAKSAAAAVKELSEKLTRQFRYLQENAGRAGVADLIGALMRKQRAELSGLRRYEREYVELKRRFEQVQGRIPQIEQQRLTLVDIDRAVAAVLLRLRESGTALRGPRLEERIRELYLTQREALESLQRDYESYSTDLIQLLAAEGSLLTQIADFRAYIERRVLWIRSTGPLYAVRWPADWPALTQQAAAVPQAVLYDAAARPLTYVGMLIGLSVLMTLRGRLRATLSAVGRKVGGMRTDSFGLTLLAVSCTLLLAVVWPALLAFAGWRLGSVAEVAGVGVYELTQALSAGLWVAAQVLLMLTLAREVCRPDGLAVAHFRWDAAAARLVRRNLVWLTVLILPARFLVAATETLPEDAWRDSLGRAALIVGLLGWALFARQVLRPERGVLTPWMRHHPDGWVQRLRYVWYPAAVGFPLLLAGASAVGFHYSAVQVTARLLPSLWVVLGVLAGQALFLRAVLVGQRRLALAQARRRQAALAQAKPDDADPEVLPVQEETVSVVEVGAQTRRLLRTASVLAVLIGLWVTWADLLPALSFVGDVRLWSYQVEQAANGAASGWQTRYITLGDVVVALIVLIVTYVLARNIPGLLEITVLQQLRMDAGGRFAVSTVARYLIVIVGVVTAFHVIGVGWSKVQWLVAAMSVGLGFGLQEIFANFVSGLMMLVERPIRIGDTVTVGNISGTVTRIRIRATTITDWDRKELIIPNKEFITGQVVNWTLSDTVVRIVVPVGVAYGSDVERVEQLLLQIARQEPNVAREPEPRALFMRFGESTLDFELRVYVPNVDLLLSTRHALNKAIEREFRQAGIEIAFPQRDIHIRSVHGALPLSARCVSDAPEADGAK